jgi:hypothetical protein
MIEPIMFEINIAASEKGKTSENFFYQKFDDYGSNKVREVIRIVNGFPRDKELRLDYPQITIDLLNEWTTIAREASNLTGNSLNWELLKIVNGWIQEKL